MTVSTQYAPAVFTGNGTTTVFNAGWRIFANDEVKVYRITIATGALLELVYGTEFTVTGAGSVDNAEVTTATAYSSSYQIRIERHTELIQETDFIDGDSFPAEVVEDLMDRTMHALQEQDARLERAILVPQGETLDELGDAEARADRVLAFDSTGQPTLIVGVDSGSAAALSLDLANVSNAAKGAALVGYDVDLSYANATVGDALNKQGRVLQGADPTGVADSTTAIKALLDLCIPNKYEAVIPAGTYLVSGTLSSNSIIASGALNLRLTGDVTITVDASASAFASLIVCHTTAINNASITGGKLTIDGNNKVGNAIYIRHAGATGGHVVADNLRLVNLKNVNIAAAENQALMIYGRYRSVKIGAIEVDTIDRSGSGTATKGVSINDIEGPCSIDVLRVRNVLSTGFSADADGLFVMGYTSGGTYSQRAGSATIGRAEIEECQGRSVKAHMQDVVIRDLTIRRKTQATFAVPDIDFQLGGGQIDNLNLIYEKNSGVSPLNASFYPISLQQQCTDRPNVARIRNVMLRAEMQIPYLTLLTVGASSLDGVAQIDNVDLQPLGAMSGSHFSRCVLEVPADQVAASSKKTHVIIRNVRGDMNGVPLLGHTGFSASVATKMSWDITGNINTGTYASGNKVVGAVSGSVIPAYLSFMCRDNAGFSDLMAAGWTFDFQTLPVGCRFHYDISGATDSNPPGAMAASGIAFVEALGSIGATAGYRSVRVTVDNANAANTVFYTQTGTWGAIK